MKSLKLLFVLFSLGICTTIYGQGVPSVNVKTLEGATVNFAKEVKKDKITIVSFWATWCSPCKRELDALNDLYEDWQDDYDVEIIAVSIDDARTASRIKPTISQKGWEFKVLLDKNQDLMRALGFQNVPYSFIFKDGKMVYSHDGYNSGDEYEMEEKLEKLSGK